MKYNYFISGVWFDSSNEISHVFLHQVNADQTFTTVGTKTTTSKIIELLPRNVIFTIKWNYQTAGWDIGAQVDTETRSGKTYLRTRPDGTTTNNLRHLLNMDFTGL